MVLDLFDSLFLKYNALNDQWRFAKKLIYAIPKSILVTDDRRFSLMPSFVKSKTIVLENYPNRFDGLTRKKESGVGITILYNGWMGANRGTAIMQTLLETHPDFKVIALGWPSDQQTKIFLKHPQVDYRGVLTQYEVLNIAVKEVDYILCLYAPTNENNINASPNKIYDAIQVDVPVIINSEVRISRFVQKNNLGVVIPSFNKIDLNQFAELLKDKKGSFNFDPKLKEIFTWERIEGNLLKAHGL